MDPQNSSSNFKRFGPNCKSYTKAIATLHEHYKLVENVNFEIEKLTRLYLENFLEKRKNKISFDSFLFHKRMFINCVYNEPVIHSFVVSVVSFFKQNNFYAQNFQASYLQIMEIFENLEQLSQTLVSKYVNNSSTNNEQNLEQETTNNNNNTNYNNNNNNQNTSNTQKQLQQQQLQQQQQQQLQQQNQQYYSYDDKAQDDLANAEYLNAQTNQNQKKATGQKLNDKSGGNKEPIYDNLNNNKDKQKRKRNKKKKKKGAKVDKENELEDGDLPKEANDSQVRKPEPEAKVIFYPEEENFEELLY